MRPSESCSSANHQCRQSDLHAAQTKHRIAHHPKPARLQLKADDKQQQGNAELSEVQHFPYVGNEGEGVGADRYPRSQVA